MSSDIKQRLFHYSEAPPQAVWEGIAAGLDNIPAYAQKLQQYEHMPPAGTWDKVATQLSNPEAKVVPLRPRLFKYAIAAAVLAVVAASAIFFVKNYTSGSLDAQPQNAVTTTGGNVPLDTQVQGGWRNGVPQDQETAIKTDQALPSGMVAVADEELMHISQQVRLGKNRIAARASNILPTVKTMIDTERADRYMIATTPTGNVVRLPKKAYSDYACAEAIQDYHCKEKIEALQSKMAASVATDFTEFMDLLKTLQETQ